MTITVVNNGTFLPTLAGETNTSFTGPGTTIPVGALGILVVACDNSNTSGTDPYSSHGSSSGNTSGLDSKGNLWTSRAVLNRTPGNVVADGTTIRIFTSRIQFAFGSSNALWINWAASTSAKCASWVSMTSDIGYVDFFGTAGSTSGTGTAFTFTTSSITNADVVLCGLALEEGTVPSDDADTTNGTWAAGQGGTVVGGATTTKQTVKSQTKIVTASATQTWNFTTANSDWAAAAIELVEVPKPPRPPVISPEPAGMRVGSI